MNNEQAESGTWRPVDGRAPGRVREALRLALFLAYAGLASLILLECGVRFLIPQPMPRPTPEIYRPDPDIGWRRNANVRIVANTGERDVEICTDARGDRVDCSVPRGVASCRGRILVLGDSFAEALAIPFHDTVWSQIERATGACVAVAGVGGYWPQQYERQTRERLADRTESFDLVVLNFYSGNDFTISADAMPGPEEVAQPRLHMLPAGLSVRAIWDWLYPINKWLESRSELYVASRFAMMRLLHYDDVRRYGLLPPLLKSGLTERPLAETTRVVERIAKDTKAAGVRLLVDVIPIQNQVVDPKGESLGSRFPGLRDDLDMDLVSERFVPRIRALPGVDQVIDLLPYFRAHAGDDAWGRRDRHFSPRGHELWFEAIRQPIEALLAKP